MYDIWWFYFVQIVRTMSLASVFGFLGAFAVYSVSSNLYQLSIGILVGAYAFAWSMTLMAPMLNFQWMATLPISRLGLMWTRLGILMTGVIVMIGFYIVTSLAFNWAAPKPQISIQAAKAAAKMIEGVETQDSPLRLGAVFGHNPLFIGMFCSVLLVFALLCISVSSLVIGAAVKTPSLSGNPWWHPDLKRRFANWSALLAPPILAAILAPAAASIWIASFNFALLLAWITYTLALFTGWNARIPSAGTRRWLAILVGTNGIVALLTICLAVRLGSS